MYLATFHLFILESTWAKKGALTVEKLIPWGQFLSLFVSLFDLPKPFANATLGQDQRKLSECTVGCFASSTGSDWWFTKGWVERQCLAGKPSC